MNQWATLRVDLSAVINNPEKYTDLLVANYNQDIVDFPDGLDGFFEGEPVMADLVYAKDSWTGYVCSATRVFYVGKDIDSYNDFFTSAPFIQKIGQNTIEAPEVFEEHAGFSIRAKQQDISLHIMAYENYVYIRISTKEADKPISEYVWRK